MGDLVFKTLETKPCYCIFSYYVFVCGCEHLLIFFEYVISDLSSTGATTVWIFLINMFFLFTL